MKYVFLFSNKNQEVHRNVSICHYRKFGKHFPKLNAPLICLKNCFSSLFLLKAQIINFCKYVNAIEAITYVRLFSFLWLGMKHNVKIVHRSLNTYTNRNGSVSPADSDSRFRKYVTSIIAESIETYCLFPGKVCVAGPPGPKGIPGNRGKRGLKGTKGKKGTKGIMGPPGEPGKQGVKGDIGSPGIKGEKGMNDKLNADSFSMDQFTSLLIVSLFSLSLDKNVIVFNHTRSLRPIVIIMQFPYKLCVKTSWESYQLKIFPQQRKDILHPNVVARTTFAII